MSASTPAAVAAVVLLVVLLVGVAAGRAKKGRWTLLAAGLGGVLVVGAALTALTGGPPGDDPALEITSLYMVTVPLAVAYAAGWLCGHGSWLRRFIVLGVAALLLAAFPYAAAGQLTADSLLSAETR